ncbi:fibrobacter succinogenes major paralogous domain-containing protein [uncultured Fibrobacter sp.]|uniref:fibrobacter succinogenes major paralogous domain-containing protein n=1 Tax=uncultured Fibrobacter sp. TaxID=261512 RepID=UPI00260D7EB4|nr:fibrobacter succinogenes major paralogous domain-containing protein [uncultured Fibrobacter sp.]
MSKKIYYVAAAAMATALLCACDDEVTEVNEVIEKNEVVGIKVIKAGEDMPKCGLDEEGSMIYMTDSAKVYYCIDKTWTMLNGKDGIDGKDGKNGKKGDTGDSGKDGDPCSLEMKADSSGYLLICGSDSVEIALNGEAEDEKDSTDEQVAQSSSDMTESSSSFDFDTRGSEFNASAKTLLDLRDSQIYKTTTIGSQIWMAQNLNYNYNVGNAKSYCYDDDTTYCNSLGRLYSWKAAMDSASLFSNNTKRGVCPEGWHVPSLEEFEELIAKVGGTEKAMEVLRATKGWPEDEEDNYNGTDTYKFAMLPGGERSQNKYRSEGSTAFFWTSSEEGFLNAHMMTIDHYNLSIYTDSKNNAFSIRCLKDSPNSNGSEYDADKNTLTDLRDNQTYRTVTIGTQTWMAQNLNYNYNRGTAKSYCHRTDSINCTTHGRLYLWSAAMDSAGVFSTAGKGCGDSVVCHRTQTVRGVCPEGWHLPSVSDFDKLIIAVGGEEIAGKMLKSTSGWVSDFPGKEYNGTDDYGFTALPAGYIGVSPNGKTFSSLNNSDTYFLSSADDATRAITLILYKNNVFISEIYKKDAYSVRCVKD